MTAAHAAPSDRAAARPATSTVSAVGWHNLTSGTTTPGGRDRPVLVGDPSDGYVLLFGGYDPLGVGWLGDTWTYTLGAWTHLTPTTPPISRSSASAAYDPGRSGVVVFGGYDYYNTTPYLNDTWLFHAGTWAQLPEPVGPSIRSEAAMSYDPALGELVLFGGYNGATYSNETWALGAGGWVRLSTPVAPPASSGGVMAYDAATSRLVLFGGTNATSDIDSTWTFNGTWSELRTVGDPGGRWLASVATLPNGTILLCGGLNRSNTGISPVDSWEFLSDEWVRIAVGGGPTSRVAAGMTYDPVDGYPLLFGGRNYTGGVSGGSDHDTWAFDSLVAQFGTFPTTGPAPFIVQPLAQVVGGPRNFDGSSSVAYAWNFGDGTTSDLVAPTHAYNLAGNDTIVLALSDAFGVRLSLSLPVQTTIPITIEVEPIAQPELSYQFTALATNDSPPVALTWQFGDGSGSALPSPTHAYQTGGSVTVVVHARDSVGGVGSASRTFVVPTALSLHVMAPASAQAGSGVTFRAVASGGAGGYSYAWAFGDGAAATGATATHAYGPGAVGNESGMVTVTDANGTSSAVSFVVRVTLAPSSSVLSSDSLLLYGGASVAALLIIVAAFVLMRRRRGVGPPPA